VSLDFELVVDTIGGDIRCWSEEPPRIADPPIPPPACDPPDSKAKQLNVDARKRPAESAGQLTVAGFGPLEVTTFNIPVGIEYGDSLFIYRFAFIPDGWSYTISDSNWIYTPDTIHVEITHDEIIAGEDTARVVLYAYSDMDEFAGCAEVMVYKPGTVTSVEEINEADLPTAYHLAQNYPNPFNPTTNIEFALPEASNVMVEVLNILGRRVAVLVDESLPAGTYRVDWNGTDHTGHPVATGVYFYRINAGDFVKTTKMLLLK
jgi:hypothetical protein